MTGQNDDYKIISQKYDDILNFLNPILYHFVIRKVSVVSPVPVTPKPENVRFDLVAPKNPVNGSGHISDICNCNVVLVSTYTD